MSLLTVSLLTGDRDVVMAATDYEMLERRWKAEGRNVTLLRVEGYAPHMRIRVHVNPAPEWPPNQKTVP